MTRATAAAVGRAAAVGGLVASLAGAWVPVGCARRGAPPAARVHTAPAPSLDERYCAWYGDARDAVLYVGESAFWWASRGARGRRGADPLGDLRQRGPVRIGRFDLAGERWLAPLELGRPGDRAGVWDVLAHPNGRVYFTTFFEDAGWVDPRSGALRRLPELGPGLNEIAPGPDGSLLLTRYAAREGGGDGSVVQLDPEGRLLAEYPLRAPEGYRAAPKTVAWDPQRREIWVTSDLLPRAGGPARHDTYLLDARGRELRRIERPEIQFAVFGGDGTGYRAELEAGRLWLRVTPSGADADSGRRVLLDGTFPSDADFAQEIRPLPGGGALVTRWSGRLHVFDPGPDGGARSLRLPRLDSEGLYYTGVMADGRVCASHCADVTVVCRDAVWRAAPAGASAARVPAATSG